jgi:hypothetical protein
MVESAPLAEWAPVLEKAGLTAKDDLVTSAGLRGSSHMTRRRRNLSDG